MAIQQQPSPPVLDRSTQLAFIRTRAAFERTMMAWVRTATSLITFGFSVYKFFQIEAPANAPHARIIGPRQFGFLLVSIGVLSLVLATFEYRLNMKAMRVEYPDTGYSLAVFVAALISLLGIIALLAMLLRQ